MKNKTLIPKKMFLTSGVGVNEDPLVSFELALRDAGIEKFNLVYVSSILPPNCKIISKEKALKSLYPGEIVFCVMAKMTSNEAGKIIYSSIGVAIPENRNINGYIAEYHGYCKKHDNVGKYAENKAAYMLKTAFNTKSFKTLSIVKKAKVRKGKYTTTVAAAVFMV